MRRLVVTENITLDGVIDMAGGWFDPLDETLDQSDITAVNAEHRAAADALLVGRTTFESFRGFWPAQAKDPTGVAAYLDAVDKYVVSGTLGDPGWKNSTVLRGPVAAEVRALKQAPGGDIVVTGSIRLVHALIAEGLVDEYRLFVFPVVVGRGARLFASADLGLRLLETRAFRSGATLLRYAAADAPQPAPATEVVRALFDAYRAQDVATAGRLLHDDFVFTSPQDDRIDKAAYLDRCFPTADRFASQEILDAVGVGGGVLLHYEYELRDGTRHRNTEVTTVRDGQVVETQVFFGGRVSTA